MSQQYYTLVTNIGAARIAKATALGTVVNLSQMAVGDGGGKPITPSATATALTREVYRASLNMLEVDENNQKQVIAELLIPEEEGDFTIREVGLFDNNNNLIAIGSIADSYKPRLSSGTASQQIIRMVIQIDNTDAVGIKVDPAVVLATREFVEQTVNKKFGNVAYRVPSIAALREFNKPGAAAVIVENYHDGINGGGGVFVKSDNQALADNAATVIVGESGTRWLRQYTALSIRDFGFAESKNNAAATIEAAERAALGVFVDCLGLKIDTNKKYQTKNKYGNGQFTVNGATVDMPYQPIRSGIGRFISGTGAAANLKSNEWTGTGLVVIGEGAMAKTEKCVSGIAIGDRAQGFSRISRDNIAIGADSLINVQAETEWYDQSKMAGTRNIGIGGNAGRGITSGFSNVSIGRNAGQGLGEGSSNIALGAGAMAGTAPVGLTGDIEVFWPSPTSRTIAIGEAVLQAYQGRSAQTAIGGNAARNTKTAEKVTVIGANAMESLEQNRAPNGGNVVWTGTETGSYTQSANTITLTFNNIRGAKVNYWVGIRLTSGTAQTLQNDVIPVKVVSVSGNNLTVNSSKELTASGSAELKFVFSDTSSATMNEELTIIGTNAMKTAVTAGYSTIIGADAALSGENYQKSTAIGASSLRTGGHISTTAIGYWTMPTASSEKCVAIGDSAGYRNVQGDILKNKITNSIAIGYGARINGDNEIQIGTTGQTLYAPTAVNIRSDGRDKTDIKPLSDGLKFVMKLKPVKGYYDRRDAYVDELFQDLPEEERAVKVREWWKNPTKDGRHKEDRQQHWFIAQDIAALEQEYGRLPMVNIKNDTYTIEYETFIPVLTKAIQELADKVEKLENENKEFKNDKMRN